MGEQYDVLFKALLWLYTGGAISDSNLMGVVVVYVNKLLVIWVKRPPGANVNDLQENKQEKDI